MINRKLHDHLLNVANYFPVVAILGPRQSGKTTLAKATFKNHTYISLENIDMRKFAQQDPRAFLADYANNHGMILDEFQNAPDLLSYIQTQVDEEQKQGYFILTSSQNFLMNEAISQTLAGRISINTLLPLSLQELSENNLVPASINELIYKGFYPPLYVKNVPPAFWYPDYIQTYLERDVRQLTQITDLGLFQTFIQLCAGRVGQLLNISSLANDCGISDNTAHRWLTLLEASYIIFFLRPHHNNFGKRLVKSPKLYFFDTGLACSLLNIQPEQLPMQNMRGNLFESLIIAELMKNAYNTGKRPHLYFWRDSLGNEIDCLIEKGGTQIPIEIKAGQTISDDYFKGLTYWNSLKEKTDHPGYVIYAGKENQQRTKGSVISWQKFSDVADFN